MPDSNQIILYHGTSKVFSNDLKTSNKSHGIEAIYLTDKPETADNYSIFNNFNDPIDNIEDITIDCSPRIYIYKANKNKIKFLTSKNLEKLNQLFSDINEYYKYLYEVEHYHGICWIDCKDDQGLRYNENGSIIYTATEKEDFCLKTNTFLFFDHSFLKPFYS